MIPSYSVTHTGWSGHHDHHRDRVDYEPRRQAAISTQQMKLLVVNLLSFSQSGGIGTIPGVPHCIHLPALVPVFVHCAGKQALFLVPQSLSVHLFMGWS